MRGENELVHGQVVVEEGKLCCSEEEQAELLGDPGVACVGEVDAQVDGTGDSRCGDQGVPGVVVDGVIIDGVWAVRRSAPAVGISEGFACGVGPAMQGEEGQDVPRATDQERTGACHVHGGVCVVTDKGQHAPGSCGPQQQGESRHGPIPPLPHAQVSPQVHPTAGLAGQHRRGEGDPVYGAVLQPVAHHILPGHRLERQEGALHPQLRYGNGHSDGLCRDTPPWGALTSV